MDSDLQRRIDENRRMLDGCLNRIATTDNINEINELFDVAANVYLCNYIVLNRERIEVKKND